MAYVRGHRCVLVSRNGHVFAQWPYLGGEIAHSVRAHEAILDGEIVCLDPDGRSNFHKTMLRREWPHFMAFDVLCVDGEDLRDWPLIHRKRRLRSLMPPFDVTCATSITSRSVDPDFFKVACNYDLEDIVGKSAHARYSSSVRIKHPNYSQIFGRREMFEARQRVSKRRLMRPRLTIAPTALGAGAPVSR